MASKLSKELNIYAELMAEIKLRGAVAEQTLSSVQARPGQPLPIQLTIAQIIPIETAILQTRYICELIALGALVAHNGYGLTKKLLKSWHPDDTFRMLEDINPDCFPQAMVMTGSREAGFNVNRVPGCIGKKELADIYGACGDLLHRGMVRHVLNGERRSYDLQKIGESLQQIAKLMMVHGILLSAYDQQIMAFLNVPGEEVKVMLSEKRKASPR